MTVHRFKFLVVVADDLGRSVTVNRAIAEANGRGIVTAASIMPGGDAFPEAVRIVHRGTLSPGLHATLCDGRAVLPPSTIPGLVNGAGEFEPNPVRAWMKYSDGRLLQQLDREIGAQFDRLAASGIRVQHVDGHHHLHLHPAVFRLVCRHAADRGVPWIRLPGDPLALVLRQNGRRAMPLLEWLYFGAVRRFRRKEALQYGLRSADAVYGLSRTGRLDESYVLGLLNRTREVTEIFAHPDLATAAGRRELHAMTSVAVRQYIVAKGMTLAGFGELSRFAALPGRKQERMRNAGTEMHAQRPRGTA